jgi:hypothetical protein
MRSWLSWSILIAVVAILFTCSLFLVFSRRRGTTVEGIYQTGPEQSAFFVNGDCSKTPLWLNWPDQLDKASENKLWSVGKPLALRLRVHANISPVGKYGHLGGYPREVDALGVISVQAATPCPWPEVVRGR